MKDDDHVDISQIPENAVPVLDHGYVLYVDRMGTDDDICEAARLSYGRGTKKVSNNEKLIKYLYSHDHTSPFEMVEMKFQIRMPIFIMRQWVRHRTANLNEYSGRYSIMPKLYYVPKPHQIKGQHATNKQASGQELDFQTAVNVSTNIHYASEYLFAMYEKLLQIGVSREMARIILPLNTYTEIVWKLDLNNLLKMLRLRDDPHAQPEIQAYAKVISNYVKEFYPMTYNAYMARKQAITLSMDELASLFSGDQTNLSKSQKARLDDIQRDLQQKLGLQI